MNSFLRFTLTGSLSVLSLIPFSSHAQVQDIVFPVQADYSFRNDFGDPRDGGTRSHLGIDIIADKMTPLVAVADGTITFIAIPEASWGYALSIRDNAGYTYRYLHINNDTPGTDDGQGGIENAYASGLRRGSNVTRGQLIGWVGDSGNAEQTISHLHFEIRDSSRNIINPYDTLMTASGGKNKGTSGVVVIHGVEATPEDEEKFLATRQLQEGLVDIQVRELHEKLSTLGYYSGELTERYDSVTREAVRRFQIDQNLPSTGIADHLTQRIMNELVSKLPKPAVAPSLNLEFGDSGEGVRALQLKLKEFGYFSAEATGYFGPLTQSALIEFQKVNAIAPASGYYGPITRSIFDSGIAIHATENSSNTSELVAAPTLGEVLSFTRDLGRGDVGEDVLTLQHFLNRQGYAVAEIGNGSLGQETDYFGLRTESALATYQRANNISPAIGYLGPITRAHIEAQTGK